MTSGVPDRRRRVREALTAAAIDLFLTKGYEETTVDEIAAAAGVGRRTFFRYFPSKEDVIFPDHEARLLRVAEVFATAPHDEPPLSVACRAVHGVLEAYLDEGVIAVQRYRLTRDFPQLRSREIASAHSYHIAVTRYLVDRVGDEPDGALWAEVAGSAVVAAHNHVLRQYLKAGGKGDVLGKADRAFRYIRETLGVTAARSEEVDDVVVAVMRRGMPLASVMSRIEDALER
ncbi:TetR family transcriptional regulator [Kibdelosporangium aridum]|uniref:TetR family transcriptional regulator n=1 Tax=Kibdelosporangium aridum TaxID=2030 RepID=UPI000524D87F